MNKYEKYEEALKSARKTTWYDVWDMDRATSDSLDNDLDVLEELLNKYKKLEKALDKACELLEGCPLTTLDDELDCYNCTEDCPKC